MLASHQFVDKIMFKVLVTWVFLPNMFPGYQYVTDENTRQKFAKAGNIPVEQLDPEVDIVLLKYLI